MIKSWPIEKNSDSYDLMTYVWLEITNVRVEIDETLDFYKIYSSEKNLLVKESLKQDLIKNIDDIFRIFDALDSITEEINQETKSSRIWRIYLNHKWIETQRLFDLKQKLRDLEDDDITHFYSDKTQASRLH